MNNKLKNPLSGEAFIAGRSNQKFSSRANQIKFNNEKAKKIRQQKSTSEKA
ncbi:MAG: hypothetical protein ABIT08_02850 [Bacteroidia bacterium]